MPRHSHSTLVRLRLDHCHVSYYTYRLIASVLTVLLVDSLTISKQKRFYIRL
jgi:hypothetical protein